MLFEELKNELGKKTDNFYMVFGKDEFMKDSAVNQIKQSAITNFAELNYNVFYSDDIDEKKFFETLDSVPFLSEKRVVVLKIVDTKKIKLLDKIDKYTVNNDYLVFITVSEDKFAIKNVKPTLVDCTKISSSIIERYILLQAKKFGATITDDAIDLIIDYSGGSMTYISNELNKCLNYSKTITTDVIDKVVTKNFEYQVFDFTNALAKKDTASSIKILNDTLKDKNSVHMLNYALYNHFRRLYYIKVSEKNDDDMSLILKVQPFAIKKMRQQLKFFTEEKLKNILKKINDNEYNIKSGKLEPENAIFNTVFFILQG